MTQHFLQMLSHYSAEILPALAVGFFISGLVHELIPEDLVMKYLGSSGLRPIFLSTLIGTLLPVCCWGSLPIAVSFYKKGARLGPILAFLVATPATSISALLVSYSVLGGLFTVYIFFAVIAMGMTMGIVGNLIRVEPKSAPGAQSCPKCAAEPKKVESPGGKSALGKVRSILGYAYIKMPKEIGVEILIGLVMAAFVAAYVPIGKMISVYLSGWFGYIFSIVFGVLMYICSTATVPLVDSLIRQGLNQGAGMALLLIGPVTSYGTILVLRKEYGGRILIVFLATLITLSVMLGVAFQAIRALL